MKKRRKRTPSLFDRFCTKFGPSILKVCRFIDKCMHPFFEGLACILTGGAYKSRPYKEPEEIKEENKKYSDYFWYDPNRPLSDSMAKDFRAIMGDFHSVGRDISKAVRRLEYENPEMAKVMQEARNSPQFQKQMQEVQKRMNEVQQQCNHIHHVCSHPTTVGSGNSFQHERQD